MLALRGRPFAGLGRSAHHLQVVEQGLRPLLPEKWDPALAHAFAAAWAIAPAERAGSLDDMEPLLEALIERCTTGSPGPKQTQKQPTKADPLGEKSGATCACTVQ